MSIREKGKELFIYDIQDTVFLKEVFKQRNKAIQVFRERANQKELN